MEDQSITIHSVKDDWDRKLIIFEVPLPNQAPVFMSVEITPYNNEERGVVIVDADKFLELWRNEPHSAHHKISHGNPQTWPNDNKYPYAAKGFSFGYNNPVPLARVSCRIGMRSIITYKFLFFGRTERKEQFHYVAFTDGITRTIWLLTQGCKAFPVECYMPEAKELYRVAAAHRTNFYTVDELYQKLKR
ncbi:MAG: plasmid fertility inhibition factor family protein [Nitrospirota bacterium]